jgi:plastocyanin
MTKRFVCPALLLLSALALALASCGGGGEEDAPEAEATTAAGGTGSGTTLQIAAEAAALAYDKTSLEATAGDVTIEFTNPSGLTHDVTLVGPGVEDEGTDIIRSGSTSITLDLQAGDYTFYCSVDGHRAAGMEGKLLVK